MVENDQAWVYIGGVKRRFVEVQADSDALSFATSSLEKGRSAGEIWAETIRPLVVQIKRDGQAAWELFTLTTTNIQCVNSSS